MKEKRSSKPTPSQQQHTQEGSLREQWEQECGPVLAQDPIPTADFDRMFRQIETTIQQEQTHSPWYEWGTHKRYMATLSVVLVLAGLILLFRPRADLHLYPTYRMIFIVCLLGIFFAFHVWYLLRPLYKPAPSWLAQHLLPWFGLFLPLILALWPLASHTTHSHSPHTSSILKETVVCLVLGCVSTAPFFWFSYRMARHQPIGYLLLSGAAGGLAGNLILQLFCPKFGTVHLVLGHATLGFLLWLILSILHKRLPNRHSHFLS